ncbi:Fic family protein [Phocoenobacter skyensis]|uniref:Fic/DOC family protein n=1 Tax=Phocoenobacter skyensis TaxID=97481 RepID=A0A1H7XG81_9PAST|nr:Fic family protein [Pasteurella skyensis]MDP8185419.1 Fic family protein [Pasteurella skyensis]QLB22182.1 cell filamentation protein Fic [Pasteurella skyensis]SEM32624.1 Fic/DOC family protein [Pasteurella skyensis]
MKLLNEIDRLKAEIQELRPLSPAELKRLRDEFIIENSYNSNAIEGNTLTLRETALILNEGITIAEKPLKHHLDIIGYKDAFNYLFDVVADNETLSERIIKDIHSLVLMNDSQNKGKYRQIQVRIMGSHHEPTEPHFIKEQITNLIQHYRQELKLKHPLEAISEFHLAFESIHPFIDGNGRTGRLLLNFELLKNGYLPIDIKFTDRAKYYACFDDYHETKHAKMFTQLVAEYQKAEQERYLKIVNG